MKINKFKHSGTFGDLIYSLPIVKYYGGGEFYLHLDQINWVGQHYYRSKPDPFHQGRMSAVDFEYMKSFMLEQPYISKFEVLDTHTTEITHNLDRFREIFVNHPGNYVDCYATVFGIDNAGSRSNLRLSTWLTVKNPRTIPGKTTVINRTQRWIQTNQLNPQWAQWREQGIGDRAVFVGLPNEHREFVASTGIYVEYLPTASMLEMAEVIAGAQQFIGNQSMALSLAIGLGTATWCEYRRDLPESRNECWGFNPARVKYF